MTTPHDDSFPRDSTMAKRRSARKPVKGCAGIGAPGQGVVAARQADYFSGATKSKMTKKWQALPAITKRCQRAWKWRTWSPKTKNTVPTV